MTAAGVCQLIHHSTQPPQAQSALFSYKNTVCLEMKRHTNVTELKNRQTMPGTQVPSSDSATHYSYNPLRSPFSVTYTATSLQPEASPGGDPRLSKKTIIMNTVTKQGPPVSQVLLSRLVGLVQEVPFGLGRQGYPIKTMTMIVTQTRPHRFCYLGWWGWCRRCPLGWADRDIPQKQ